MNLQIESHAEMTVTWTTYKPTPTLVQYGTKKDSLNLETTGNFTTFIDNGNRTHYIHRVRLVKLNLKTTYCELNYLSRETICKNNFCFQITNVAQKKVK